MITDELREFTKRYVYFKAEVMGIADRIDEQHRKALEKVAAMVDEPTELDKLKGHLDGLDKIAAECRFNIVALERRISAIERKLNHKGVE